MTVTFRGGGLTAGIQAAGDDPLCSAANAAGPINAAGVLTDETIRAIL